MKRKTAFFFVVLCLVLLIPFPSVAAIEQNVRVGLVSEYMSKSTITIKNSQVTLGYSVDQSYQKEQAFSSTNGFKFITTNGYYYILNKTYTCYKDAKQVADKISSIGVDAYPVVCYRAIWKVYVGGSTNKDTVNGWYQKIKDKFGFTYSSLQSDNSHRLKIVGSNDEFLVDILDSKKAYPQFMTTAKNAKNVAIMDLGTRQYRGRIEIGRYGSNQLTAVNIVPLEQYLYGVVPCEMISTWPLEALKAQAVCARSYALRTAGYRSDSNIKNPYVMVDTTSSQVYRGYQAETARTNQAVDETKGKMVCYNNQIISTYYYSTSGGSTESVEDVWSLSKPYLRSVPDLYELEPEKAPWIIKYTKSEIEAKLLSKGIKVGTITSIFPEITTSTGRVYSLKVRGTKSSSVLQKGTIRSILSLPSTKFTIVKYKEKPDTVFIKGSKETTSARISDCYIINGNHQITKASSELEQYIVMSDDNLTNFSRVAPADSDTIYFAGQGSGHGIGMSQSGAKGMAKAGYSYIEILEYYYPGAKVQ